MYTGADARKTSPPAGVVQPEEFTAYCVPIRYTDHRHSDALDVSDFQVAVTCPPTRTSTSSSTERGAEDAEWDSRLNLDFGAGEQKSSVLDLDKLKPRPKRTLVRWIALKNTAPSTFKILLSTTRDSTSVSSDDLENSVLGTRQLRLGRFKYVQEYAESDCCVFFPVSGPSTYPRIEYSPQLSIYLPFFKWNSARSDQTKYANLRDYAQPSTFQRTLPLAEAAKGYDSVLPIVVHQLWLFVTDPRTLVSFHPHIPTNAADQLDVDLDVALKGEIPGLTTRSPSDLSNMSDAFALVVAFVRQACLLQISGPLVKTPMIPYLEQVVASLAGKRIEAYSKFSITLSKGHGMADIISHERNADVELLLETIKVVEELESFLFVLDSQGAILRQMDTFYQMRELSPARGAWGTGYRPVDPRMLIQKTLDELANIQRSVNRLIQNATKIQTAMLQLLDLKQKETNILEAQYTRRHANEAATQGKILFIFTLTTVIFLPFSVFTSYFGMNVSALTGSDANPTQATFWKICGPLTFLIVGLIVICAYYDRLRESVVRPTVRRVNSAATTSSSSKLSKGGTGV